MKEIISEQEIKKFNYYGSIYTVHLAVLIISAVPLFMWLGRYVNNPVPVSLLSGDRKPQIRFLGNHHSGSGNLYHKSFRM